MIKRRVRSTRLGFQLEEFRQLIPVFEADFKVPWLMEPEHPFRVQMWHDQNEVEPVWATKQSFAGAMTLATAGLPPKEGACLTVLDEGFRVVFGYVSTSAMLVEFGAPCWYGCERAYEWMERSGRFDLMDLAVWESTAKERAL